MNSIPCGYLSVIKCVVFGLDGTLADSADLAIRGNQMPSDLLDPLVTATRRRGWEIELDGQVDGGRIRIVDIPGELIVRGYVVGIATNSGIAYASTMCHLLGVDTEFLLAAGGRRESKVDLIREECDNRQISIDEVLYVGSESGDHELAAAGMSVLGSERLRNGNLLEILAPVLRGARPRGSYAYQEVWSMQHVSRLRNLLLSGARDAGLHEKERSVVDNTAGMTQGDICLLDLATLQLCPSVGNRREIQSRIFRALSPGLEKCLAICRDGLFRMDPRIVSRAELRRDPELRREYLHGLTRIFPSLQIRISGTDVDGIAVRVYGQSTFGNILGEAKQYGREQRYGERYRSGRAVRLGQLDLVADAMAAHATSNPPIPLVPVPATPFTVEQPGEVSVRLATAMGRMMGSPILQALTRIGDEFQLVDGIVPQPIVLVDDQTTHGAALRECSNLLSTGGFEVVGTVVYSASQRTVIENPPVATQVDCPRREIMSWLDLSCECRSPEAHD